MAKKSKAAVSKTGRRGGRKPGAWTLISPDALRAWRDENKVSRAHLASMLGVSSTSVQNWETGHAVATTKTQQRLVELTKRAPGQPQTTRPAASTAANGATAHTSAESPTLIQATASIVTEAIRAKRQGCGAEGARGAHPHRPRRLVLSSWKTPLR